MTLVVLHEDEDLIVIDKPSGWVVHHGWTRDAIACVDVVSDYLHASIFPVHRLDRGTSGVLLFAKSANAAAAIQPAFTDGRVSKHYVALVRGEPAPSGHIDAPVPSDEDGPRVNAITDFTTRSTIRIESTQREKRYSLIDAFPRTGRFHQIRRHMKHVNCPVIGDANYGRSEHNHLWRDRYALHRLALHAQALTLPDWRSNTTLNFIAKLPADLREPLNKAGFTVEELLRDERT